MMTDFTPGPWKAIQVYGWGDTPCILHPGQEKPFANIIRPKEYYTDFVRGIAPDGSERTILSEDLALKAGNYVPTKQIKMKIEQRQWADAHLMAAAPEMFDALLQAELITRELCEGQDPENECWVVLSKIRSAIAKARNELGKNGLKPDTWYRAENGAFVEVVQ